MEFRLLLCVLWAVVAMAAGAAGQEPAATVAVSPTMTFDQIERAMDAYPPSFDHPDQRLAIMESLDRLMTVDVKKMTESDRPRLAQIVAFYRQRVDRGLDALEDARVTEGVRVFKFYSSSVVLKSDEGAAAVDFCQGPVQNGGEPETSDQYKTGMYLTPQQRDRLAHLVDVQLVTHRHHDHADYSLARRLLAAGKPVVGPAQLKTQWPDLGPKLRVPRYETAEKIGPCEIYTQFGYQFATSSRGADGEIYGHHDPADPSRSSESVRYLIRMAGITFLQSAENQVEADRWLAEAAKQGWRVDVLLSPGQYQGGRSVTKTLRGYFHLPLHEYEMTHDGGGNRTASHLQGAGRKAFDAHRAMPLLWGESFLVTPGLLAGR